MIELVGVCQMTAVPRQQIVDTVVGCNSQMSRITSIASEHHVVVYIHPDDTANFFGYVQHRLATHQIAERSKSH